MDLGKPPEQRVADLLVRFPSVDRVILFGSRARGDADPRSDIDLAINCPRATAKDWLDILDAVEDAETLLFIDLIRLEETPADLRNRIEAEGRVIYDRQGDAVDCEPG